MDNGLRSFAAGENALGSSIVARIGPADQSIPSNRRLRRVHRTVEADGQTGFDASHRGSATYVAENKFRATYDKKRNGQGNAKRTSDGHTHGDVAMKRRGVWWQQPRAVDAKSSWTCENNCGPAKSPFP